MKAKKTILLLLIIILCSMQMMVSYGSSSYTNLKFGSRGTKVIQLQQALQNRGLLQKFYRWYIWKINRKSSNNFWIIKNTFQIQYTGC